MSNDLQSLATVRSGIRSMRSSSYDRTGGNADNITDFDPRTAITLLDTSGPGRVTHIWLTISGFFNHPTLLRDLVIRMFWDGAPTASVDVPLGDFFVLGHAMQYPVSSLPVAVGSNTRALNCYWPMPFHKHARIELYNNGKRSVRRVYFNVDYELGSQPPDQGLFHALFRYQRDLLPQVQEGNLHGRDNYVLFETEGRGQYVGCAMFVDARPGGWWGEGDDMIFIDHADLPTINGTGTEDYFCNAWGYTEPFCNPYYGAPLVHQRADGGSATSMYRWHIADPVRFNSHIRVTMEHVGKEAVAHDYSSVAYWYQLEPMRNRPTLPFAEANHPKLHDPPHNWPEIDGTELESQLQGHGRTVRSVTAGVAEGYSNGGWLRVEGLTGPIEIALPVPLDGSYRVKCKLVSHVLQHGVRIRLADQNAVAFEKIDGHESTVPQLDLGIARSRNRQLQVNIEGSATIGIDSFYIEPTDQSMKPASKSNQQSEKNDAFQ